MHCSRSGLGEGPIAVHGWTTRHIWGHYPNNKTSSWCTAVLGEVALALKRSVRACPAGFTVHVHHHPAGATPVTCHLQAGKRSFKGF